MTERTDVARGRDIVARWSALAEQRLDYLTKLYETGRWRRYHTEDDFLENIREARGAVEAWRSILTADATPDNRPVDLSWLGRRSAMLLANRQVPAQPIAPIVSQLAELVATPPMSVLPPTPEPKPQSEPEPVVVLEAKEALQTAYGLETADEIETAEALEVIQELEASEEPQTVEEFDENPLDKTLALTLDIVGMAGRYPLLSNAFQQPSNG